MSLDQFPNIFISTLAQSLPLSGSNTEVFLSTIQTLDGQVMQTGDFALLGRGVLTVDCLSAPRIEFISFTGVDVSGSGVTGCVRGLSFKNDAVIPANAKFHPVGTPVLIAFGTHNLRDLERLIQSVAGNTTVVDTNSINSGGIAVSSLTFPLNSSGIDPAVAVQVSTTNVPTVTATYGGTPMVQKVISSSGGLQTVQFFLTGIPSGSSNVIINFSVAAIASAGGETLQNVNQAIGVGAVNSSNGNSTIPSVTLTTTQTNSVIIDSLTTSILPVTFVPNSGQDLNWIQNVIPNTIQGASSIQSEGTAPVTATAGYTITPSAPWVMTAMEVIPSGNDQFVKVNSSDSTAGYLQQKLSIGSADGTVVVIETVQNPNADEVLHYDLSAQGGGGGGTKLAIDTSEVIVNNSTSEENLYTVIIPEDILGTNNGIRYKILANISGNNLDGTVTFRQYYGGSLIGTATGILSSATSNTFDIQGMIVADNSSSAQKGVINAHITTDGSPNQIMDGYGTATVTSTSAQDLLITVQFSSLSQAITTEGIVVEELSNPADINILPFQYGETISINDYVFQANGTESKVILQTVGTNAGISITTNTDFQGQSITIDLDIVNIQAVTLKMERSVATFVGTVTLKIYALSGGVPTGSALATSTPITVSTGISTTSGPVKFIFSPFTATPGTDYGFVVDTSTITSFGGGTITLINQLLTGGGYFVSTNSGSTWATQNAQLYYIVEQGLTLGSVYLVDETNIFNSGPYIGFAKEAGTIGDVRNVQLPSVISGFTGLTESGQVYIDSATPGGITQTQSGRSIGIATSPTQIEAYNLYKTELSLSTPTAGMVIPSDGFIIFSLSGIVSIIVSNDNFIIDTVGITYVTGSSGVLSLFTLPVKQGNGYTTSGSVSSLRFYRTLNG